MTILLSPTSTSSNPHPPLVLYPPPVSANRPTVEKSKDFESIVDILPTPLPLGNPELLNTGVEMLTVVGWPSPNGQRTIYADRYTLLSLADGMIKSRAFIHDASRHCR